jgi:hypothetical protein
MDVGFYLGELLMQQGEVSVPGLGYFVQARMSGYYDENEGKFYPPYHKAQFDLQSIDDDDLAEYIAKKKNISVSSAKYFAEKYITSLKQEALIGEVPIGNLGWFYTELTQLTFRPADKIIDDTVFYGFEPVSIKKPGNYEPEIEQVKTELKFPSGFTRQQPPVEVETQAEEETPPTVYPQETATYPRELEEEVGLPLEYLEEETGTGNTTRTALIILTIVVLLSVGVYAFYRYKPDAFSKLIFWRHHTTAIVAPVKPKVTTTPEIDTTENDTLRSDTLRKDSVKTATADTVKKVIVKVQAPKMVTAVAVKKAIVKTEAPKIVTPDTIKGPRFEVIVADCKNMAEADKAMKKLEKRGLTVRIVTDAPGPDIQISAATFKTYHEALKNAVALESSGKVTTDAYPLEIKPKK